MRDHYYCYLLVSFCIAALRSFLMILSLGGNLVDVHSITSLVAFAPLNPLG